MSQRQVKAARRVERERLVERIAQAHDCLHRDDVDGCHAQLHAAMGAGDVPVTEPLAHLEAFDRAFRALAVKHGRVATYVAIDTVDEHGLARLISGGDAQLAALVDRAVRFSGELTTQDLR